MSTTSATTIRKRNSQKDAAHGDAGSAPASSSGKRSSGADKQLKATTPQASPFTKFMTRVVVGFAMIGAFGMILYGGHLYAWLMVVILQILLFRELVNVRYRAAAEKNIPWFRSVQVRATCLRFK